MSALDVLGAIVAGSVVAWVGYRLGRRAEAVDRRRDHIKELQRLLREVGRHVREARRGVPKQRPEADDAIVTLRGEISGLLLHVGDDELERRAHDVLRLVLRLHSPEHAASITSHAPDSTEVGGPAVIVFMQYIEAEKQLDRRLRELLAGR